MATRSTEKRPENRHRFKTFSERLSEVNIDVVHRISRVRDTQDIDTYFGEGVQKWKELNCTQHFSQFHKEVCQKCSNYTQVVHHELLVRLLSEGPYPGESGTTLLELTSDLLLCEKCSLGVAQISKLVTMIYQDPRKLPCGHTFSANCLEHWRYQQMQNGQSQFSCPMCHFKVRLEENGIDSIPVDMFTLKLLDLRDLYVSEKNHFYIHCRMCDSGGRMAGSCQDCHFLLCKNCLTAHSNTPALKDHHITLDDHCPKHTDQCMTFYCQPCAKLVCRDCAKTEHQPGPDHDPQEVSKVALEVKAELKALAENSKETFEIIKRTDNIIDEAVTSNAKNCKIQKEKIRKHFSQLRAKLDKEEQEVTLKLDQMEQAQMESFPKEKKLLEDTLRSKIRYGLESCSDMLARFNDVQIVTDRQQMKDRLLEAKEIHLDLNSLKQQVSFQPNTEMLACSPGSLSLCTTSTSIIVTEPAVEIDVGSNNPVLRFGQLGSQQGQFDRPIGVAVRGDRLYVADLGNNRVQVFDLSGNFLYTLPRSEHECMNPISLAVQEHNVVVKSGLKVIKYSPFGELLYGFPLGKFSTNPYALAVQRDGRVIVTDPGNHSILLFEADETMPNVKVIALVKKVGGQGQGEGQFNQPYFVCVDKEDNIIVADKSNNRVQVFDKDLNFRHKFGQYGRQPQDMMGPHGVSADSRGNIVLANLGGTTDGVRHDMKLQVFRPDGSWISSICSDGDKLNLPHGVAVTEDGHVFVTDTGDHCIRKYRYM
uniref:RING-type domain-containing protein n=1 Tax=Branchiostoma floridae TaxID=7739 RepID=C3ZQ23_BRAFL|eukprot:XP_002589391.1 hypothetical protein BRAFLDRAFT_77833 [Branchiostoma floridae]